MSQSASFTSSYTNVDVEKVVRRFGADLAMIAQSSAAITETKASQYAHDIELLAKKGYLRKVDLTLLDGLTELKACTYEVNEDADGLSMSRPGGVMWPRVTGAYLRVTLFYSDAYDDAAKERVRSQLEINWVPSTADTSHRTLTSQSNRDYASNGWGLQRVDYSA